MSASHSRSAGLVSNPLLCLLSLSPRFSTMPWASLLISLLLLSFSVSAFLVAACLTLFLPCLRLLGYMLPLAHHTILPISVYHKHYQT